MRRHPGDRGPAPPLLHPLGYQRLVGSCQAAQPRGAPGQRLVELALGRPLEEPGHLGQQVTPAASQRTEFGQRGRFLLPGERAPPGVMPRLAGQLSHQNPVGTRSEMILTHPSRVEYDYVKGKMNSRNELHVIWRALTARQAGSSEAWFMTVPGMSEVTGRAARCYRSRYLSIRRLNYLGMIRHGSARIAACLITWRDCRLWRMALAYPPLSLIHI